MELLSQLQALSHIGLQPDGSVTRVSASIDYLAACDLVAEWMEEVGMKVEIDSHNNVIGTLPGLVENAPPIVVGSHIDTVVGGGKYDGSLGVLAGLEVARRGPYKHPLKVVAFYDEEVTMDGSKGFVNDREAGDVALYLELHVEQGPVLDTAKIPIGVVTGIVGQRRLNVSFKGTANHAGTTPMDMRDDALVKAGKFIVDIEKWASMHDGLVATVGVIENKPNRFSIIPNEVNLPAQIRDLDAEVMDYFVDNLKEKFPEAEFEYAHTSEPCICDDEVMMLIEFACMNIGLEYKVMPSRASHDAQNFGTICPVGMIFVPSVGGVSHDGTEHTESEDLENGCHVLCQAVKAFDNLG